jgi:hypothetical protein
MNLKPADLIVVSRLFEFEPRRVANQRQNLSAQVRVVFEERVQDQHPDRRCLSGLHGLDTESIVRGEDHLGGFGRIVAIDLVDVNEILEEQCQDNFVNPAQRLCRVLRTGLDESGDPLHKGLSDKLILAPAIQIDEATHLTAGDHGEQVETVGKTHSHYGEKDLFKRGGLNKTRGIVTRQKLVKLGLVFDSQTGTH